MIDFTFKRRLYLCCYDISDNKIRKNTHRIVKSFASGGQKSAYECFLSIKEHTLLLNLINAIIEDTDSFVLQPISPVKNMLAIGKATKPINLGFTYIG